MQLLSFNFFIYSLSGVWRPVKWSSSCAKLLYNVFIVCTISQLYFLLLTQFMDLVLIVDNVDDFTNNSLIFVTMIAVCCKATVVVLRRSTIINVVDMLLKEPCKPCEEDERAIQVRFDRFIRSCSIKYTLLATGSVTSGTIRSVLNMMQGQLPYRVWLPYDWNKSPMFLITSIHQIIILIFATFINIGTETLVFGFILQTCAQLEILQNRLNKSVINVTIGSRESHPLSTPNRKQATISEHIHHHLSIYTSVSHDLVLEILCTIIVLGVRCKYAKAVNSVFNQMLFVQFFGSILVLCTSVYYLSMHIGESEAMGFLVYTICMFVQIFVYCWSGNEVILKSVNLADTVYHMDWFLLLIRDRKDLLMIMRRSAIPIKFTSSFLITLSLQSYGNILKMSYSAFSALRQS